MSFVNADMLKKKKRDPELIMSLDNGPHND